MTEQPPASDGSSDDAPHAGWSPEQPPTAAAWTSPGAASWAPQPTFPAEYASGQSYPPPGYPGTGWTRPQAPKPGVIPLRPLGLSELLDGAFTYIRRSPAVVLGISAVVAVLSNLVSLLFSLQLLSTTATSSVLLDQNAAPRDVRPIVGQLLGGTALTLLVTLVFQVIGTGMLTIVITRAVLGQDIGWQEAWTRSRPLVLPLLALTFLTTLLSAGGLLLCIVPGVFLYVSWAIAVPALMVERCGVIESMRRSWRLTSGSRWRVLGILLLMQIIASFVGNFIQTPFAVAGIIIDGTGFAAGNGVPVAVLVLSAIGGVVASTITLPFTAGVVALLYVDLRMRREGLDLQLQQAATTPAPSAAAASTTSPWTS